VVQYQSGKHPSASMIWFILTATERAYWSESITMGT